MEPSFLKGLDKSALVNIEKVSYFLLLVASYIGGLSIWLRKLKKAKGQEGSDSKEQALLKLFIRANLVILILAAVIGSSVLIFLFKGTWTETSKLRLIGPFLFACVLFFLSISFLSGGAYLLYFTGKRLMAGTKSVKIPSFYGPRWWTRFWLSIMYLTGFVAGLTVLAGSVFLFWAFVNMVKAAYF